MEIQIQILSTSVETKPTAKGSYQMLEVAYKELSNGGKVASKKVMSFTNKDVFTTLSTAKPTDVYDVTMEKGEKYWEWIKVEKSVASAKDTARSPQSSGTSGTVSSAPAKGNWETPEERARKQVYIVRQSTLSLAVETLSVGAKTAPKPEEIIDLAKRFEAHVFGTGSVETVVAQDVGTIETMAEDIPF